MSEIKRRMTAKCNGDFIFIKGWITCTILAASIDEAKKDISIDSTNEVIGKNLIFCLKQSKELTNDEWDFIYGSNDQQFMESMEKEADKENINFVQKYLYKDDTALKKNMMACWIDSELGKLTISSSAHTKLTTWDWADYNIKIYNDAPPEIIGAAVRYAFSKCIGKGAYAKGAEIVTKALFPDGVPNSLEEYLESIDPDYKKWLVIDN